MKYNPPFDQLTEIAKITLQLALACKTFGVLRNKVSVTSHNLPEEGEKTYNWVQDCLKDCFNWLAVRDIDGQTFYEKKLGQAVNFIGYYHHLYQPKENAALEVCWNAIAYTCLVMLKYDQMKGVYPSTSYPSDLQFTSEIFDETLYYAQKASEDPEAEKIWQDQIIAKLLKDHYTEDPNEFGENISREYIEELLGEKLPF